MRFMNTDGCGVRQYAAYLQLIAGLIVRGNRSAWGARPVDNPGGVRLLGIVAGHRPCQAYGGSSLENYAPLVANCGRDSDAGCFFARM